MWSSHESDPLVFVVDDDSSQREAIAALLAVNGLSSECFASPQEFLKRKRPDVASCLILDVRLPGGSGLSVQADLAKIGIHIPIIFMTAYADIPMSVHAMKAGAVDFLSKPFRQQDMLDAIHSALQRDLTRRESDRSESELRSNFARLTAREREILQHVAAGLMNKQIAAKMGIAEITVKIHRGRVTRKMGARSVATLVKMAQALGISAGGV